MKTETRTRLAEVIKKHKEMDNLSSEHWSKVIKLETERRVLLLQIIKEEKLLSDGVFSFKIETYVQRRSCVLEGPVLREMKRLEQLLKNTPDAQWDHFSFDLGKGDSLTINDGDVFISIHNLTDVQKVISDWDLRVEFKNLANHKEKLVEDLKVINNIIRKITKKGEKK